MKTCRKCSIEKPNEMMKADPRYRDGVSSYCKACHQAASVAWQKANPEKVNAGRRVRYQANREKINSARRSSYDYDTVKWVRLRALYRASQDWYETQLASQGGVCAICQRPPDDGRRALHVDHNHDCCKKTPTCGKCNRGILCHSCNTALHAIERDPKWMASAMRYLGVKES